MKSITKMMKTIPNFIWITMLALASTATIAGNDNSEAANITKALEQYVKAGSMDIQSAERKELLDSAESTLTDVIKKNPKSLDAHRKLMGVYLQKRDYRKATETMQTAITLSPEDPKLFIALAILYDHQGAYKYALPILDQALTLDPDDKMAQDYKTSIQQKAEKQRLAMEESSKASHNMAKPHSKPDTTK